MLAETTAYGHDTPRVKLYRSLRPPSTAQIEDRAELLRETMERSAIVEWITERLTDPRAPKTITYPLWPNLLRTNSLLLGHGWRPGRLRPAGHDPTFRVAYDSRRGTVWS